MPISPSPLGPSSALGNWLLVWAIVAAGIFLVHGSNRRHRAGLVPAYVLNLGLLHWLGGALYILPWYTHHDPDIVTLGLQQSTFALIGFGVGALLLAPTLVARAARIRDASENLLARKYMLVGVIVFFGFTPIIGRLPTLSAIAVQGWNLLIVGLCLTCWLAWRAHRSREFLRWLCIALCLPLVTVITAGFLGYGIAGATAILAFVASFYRPRWRMVLAALALAYVGLSLYVTYMRDRVAIREVVWSGQPLMARLERVQQTVSTFEWFDWHSEQHLIRIDDRLNQDVLVGSAVEYIDAGLAHFAYGQSIFQGFVAVVPRAIWPTKPVVGGSGTLVTQYTGIQFAQGTAVGIGHVMDAYVSFGTPAVLVGFMLLGAVVGGLDAAAGQHLQIGDFRGFLMWFLPGLSFLQVGGSLTELTSSVAAALLSVWLINRLLRLVGTDAPGSVPLLAYT